MAEEICVWGEGRTGLWHYGESVDIPPEYVEVPTDDPYLTRTIKAQAETVYVRMKKPKGGGYSRPTAVFAPEDAVDAARAMAEETERARQLRRKSAAEYRARKEQKSQTEMSGRLLEAFPGMPEDEARMIVAHAFEVGSGRVGRTSSLDPAEKLDLAVRAHIRHVHTAYEKLLMDGWDREEARDAVRADVNAVYERWQQPQ